MADIRTCPEESTDNNYLRFNSIFTAAQDTSPKMCMLVSRYLWFLDQNQGLEAGVVSQWEHDRLTLIRHCVWSLTL